MSVTINDAAGAQTVISDADWTARNASLNNTQLLDVIRIAVHDRLIAARVSFTFYGDLIPLTPDYLGWLSFLDRGQRRREQGVSYISPDVTFTGALAGTLLTVTGSPTGTLKVGQTIGGAGVNQDNPIASLGTGTGGAGTYNMGLSQTLASQAMFAIEPFQLDSTDIVFLPATAQAFDVLLDAAFQTETANNLNAYNKWKAVGDAYTGGDRAAMLAVYAGIDTGWTTAYP